MEDRQETKATICPNIRNYSLKRPEERTVMKNYMLKEDEILSVQESTVINK